MGVKIHLGSFGVTGVKMSFSHKNAVTRPLYIARPYDSNMYISLRPSTYVMGVIGQPWGHLGSQGSNLDFH